MNSFRRRPGIVLEEICGAQLLIATCEARESCPYVTRINDSAAAFWRILEGAPDTSVTVQDLAATAAECWGKDRQETLVPALFFVKRMTEKGFLIEEAE